MTRPQALEAFWQGVLAAWAESGWACDLDGFAMEEQALAMGLLRRATYDPALHGEMDAEPGDEISVPVPVADRPDA